ncbi:MAG: YdeI/OmpD-associated family protein [Candidatus Saccharimonadales bacterium]
MIQFQATLKAISHSTILQLPEAASRKLPSRGQVFVKGTLNGYAIQEVIEPDGNMGHWLKLNKQLLDMLKLSVGDNVTLEVEPSKDWPEPTIPADFSKALKTAPSSVQELWPAITPMARWEWIRWVSSTHVVDTRKRRVEVSISKMESGKRRPCCFNLSSCTDPDLAKSGKLI